jgi:hypothetical protein
MVAHLLHALAPCQAAADSGHQLARSEWLTRSACPSLAAVSTRCQVQNRRSLALRFDNREPWRLSYRLGLVGGPGGSLSCLGHFSRPQPSALLVAENLCLRQPLLVVQRRCPQPRLRNADRQS